MPPTTSAATVTGRITVNRITVAASFAVGDSRSPATADTHPPTPDKTAAATTAGTAATSANARTTRGAGRSLLSSRYARSRECREGKPLLRCREGAGLNP